MILYTILVVVIFGVLFVNFHPTFGSNSNGDSLDKIKNSKNFNGKKFVNLVPTRMMINRSEAGEADGSIMSFFFPAKDKNPQKPLPSKKFDGELKNGEFVWFGHSTILMKTGNMTIITDPVYNRASPILIAGKPFEYENKPEIKDLPKIDVVMISHDHYDHLDYKSIKYLSDKVDRFYVPLGVKAHLIKWGVPQDKIIEKDWYENSTYKNINFTFAPTRHFSGRGLTNRDSTLWGSWIVKSSDLSIYFSGDSGYFDEFEKIGNKYGPFDIAFIENGAYNKDWANIHMFPEQSVQAALDVKAEIAMPIHWAKFDLSYHKWTEPIERFTAEAEQKNLSVATPLVGEKFNLKNVPTKDWWKE